MKNDKERNYFSLRTMFWKCLIPMLKCITKLKSAPQKLEFLMAKGIQKRYTLNCSHKCPCTSPHSYAFLRHLVFKKNHFM